MSGGATLFRDMSIDKIDALFDAPDRSVAGHLHRLWDRLCRSIGVVSKHAAANKAFRERLLGIRNEVALRSSVSGTMRHASHVHSRSSLPRRGNICHSVITLTFDTAPSVIGMSISQWLRRIFEDTLMEAGVSL